MWSQPPLRSALREAAPAAIQKPAAEALLVASGVGEGEHPRRGSGSARPARSMLGASGRERATCPRRRAAGHGVEPERRFDAARAAFAEAAGLDPLLDLTRTPAFWKLERAAHEAAIDAYLQAGRERDAAVLRARVQSTFRPKPLRPRPQVMLSP